MAMDYSSIEQWRKYFRTATGDIFQVIENAITIAGLDYPKDFRIRRDRIVEKMFVCHLNRCVECDRLELAAHKDNDDECIKLRSVGNTEGVEEKERKMDCSETDGDDVNVKYTDSYRHHEAEALTAEIGEENQTITEVLRIKELLFNSEDQSEDLIIESLRRLQLMSLSVQTLEATQIGKAVGHLKKHKSKCISNFARSLIKEWKVFVEKWISVVPDIKGQVTPDSTNPSIVEQGHPSPPLDEEQDARENNLVNKQTSRPPKIILRHRVKDDEEIQGSKHLNTETDQLRLEAAKRKLHKGYQQAENAKKQRTVQVMELEELPKQGLGPGNSRMRPGRRG